MKKPFDGAKIVDQVVLRIVQEIEAGFTHIVKDNQKSRVYELVIVGSAIKVPQHLDVHWLSNYTQPKIFHVKFPPSPPPVLPYHLPTFFDHNFNDFLWWKNGQIRARGLM